MSIKQELQEGKREICFETLR